MINRFFKFGVFSVLLLFLSGCWFQEQLCNMSMEEGYIKSVREYDNCKAINDSAFRGSLIDY